jgi:hypothetical protein
MAAVAVAAFWPGLRAGFVSDAFAFLERTRSASAADVASWFVPQGSRFFRPLYRLALAGAQRAFGAEPLGYHALALLAHIAAAVLLSALALRLGGGRAAAAVAGFAFLLSPHAHEVVYDVAALHHALGGALLVGAVVALAGGRPGLAVLLAAVALGVNELALLALPLALLCGLSIGTGGADRRPGGVTAGVLALAGLTAAYFAWRLLVAGASLPSEGPTCRVPRCLAVAAVEYLNRLAARPDALLAMAWTDRPAVAAAVATSALAILALLGPWRWQDWRGVVFGAAWLAAGAGYAVLALWPYVADRFLHAPAAGLALLLGSAVGEALAGWPRAGRLARTGIALGVAAVALWIGLGAGMLRARGALWTAAGLEAERIVRGIVAAVPDPAPGAVLCVANLPDSHRPLVPPGNTGPYVFRNGLGAALRTRYGRSDVEVTRICEEAGYELRVEPATVRLVRTP